MVSNAIDDSGAPAGAAASASPALYVDLDGTLIASDILWESLAKLAHQSPLGLLASLAALRGGRAAFKQAVAERVSLDAALLPYRPEVVEYLATERARGRRCACRKRFSAIVKTSNSKSSTRL